MPHHQAAAGAPETKGSVIHWAGFYDTLTKVLMVGRESETRRVAIDAAHIRPGDRVLDVGCGTGTLALMAKERTGPTGEVHGIDASPEMIDVAQRKATKEDSDVRFQVGLIEKLPFPDAHFDVVLSSFMLHHLPDDLKRDGLREIARVIKPGGRLVAVDLSGASGGPLLWRLVMLMPGHRMHRLAPDYPQQLAAMIEGAGLAPALLPGKQAQFAVIRAEKAA
jgi:demethylmenaquinone methyltransferase/2-methoxy-6-polyprenyl-1,4-benzoquinol methylase/phosphoethanolamine N-methyltransferase